MATRPIVLITPLRDAGAVDSRLRVLERENATIRGLGGTFALGVDHRAAPAAALQSARAILKADGASTRGPAGLEVRLALDDPLAKRLARVDGEIVGRRLLDAAERTISRQLDGYQGIVALRYEDAGSFDRPLIQVILSPTRADGTSALTPPPHVRIALEQAWRHETYRTFGLRIPTPQPEPQRVQVQELEKRWREVSREFQEALQARVQGRLTQPEFAQVFLRTQDAREAFAAAARGRAPDAAVRAEILHLRLERGADLLRPLTVESRDATLQRAVAGVAAPGTPATVVTYGVGEGDLGAILYFTPGSIDRGDLKARIEGALATALRRQAIEHGLPDQPALAVRVGFPAQPEASRPLAGAPEHAPVATAPPVAVGAAEPPRRWMEGRISSVVVRVPNVEALANVRPEIQQQILERAVDRAWPGFERAGVRGNFLVEFRGGELRLKVLIPERQVEALAVLHRPLSHARITNEIHRGLAEHAGDRSAERVVLRPPRDLPAPSLPASVQLTEHAARIPGGIEERTFAAIHRIEGGAQYLDHYAPADMEKVVHAALRDAYHRDHPFEASQRLDVFRETRISRHGADLVIEVPAGRAADVHWYERSLMGGPDAGARFGEAFGRAIGAHEGQLARESDLAAYRLGLARAAGRDELGHRWFSRTLHLGDARLVQQLPLEVRRDIVRQAIEKTFPELRDRRLSVNVEAAIEDRTLVVRVAVPDTQPLAVRALDSPDAVQRLAETMYRDPRVPVPAAGLPPLERAGEVTIRVVEDRFRLDDGTMVRGHVAIHRIEGGAEYLARFSADERSKILEQALRDTGGADRRESHDSGARDHVREVVRGRDLEVHVPAGHGGRARWWERKLMESPATGRRFSDALSAAVARHEGRQLLPHRESGPLRSQTGISRLVDAPLRAMQHSRNFTESPVQAAGQLAKDMLLSRAIPAPMRPVARVLARLIRRDE